MKHEDFLEAYLKDRRNIVEEALDRYLPAGDQEPRELHAAMRYSVFAGGKRIRPILCMASAEACGGDLAPVMPVACALELIHTYSLIHDDLPSMDNDDFRRGKPTSHKVFGEAAAILAGDALLTEAFALLSRAEKVRLAAERRLAVIQEIALAAGAAGMVGGQALDIRTDKEDPDIEALTDMHRRKTGALIMAAVKTGALIAGADERKLSALTGYANRIGVAFQIADDILNVEGDERLMGKRTGSDAARGKITYASLLGLEAAKARLADEVGAAAACIASFDARALPLRAIARFIMERKS
ncbi:MAG: polyprenyl synthetase family protein [Smithellaceae bacterium]|jgi:geranylgeranyl diphosphate synthase, type II|nr:polyprenyl synthetase family protein [Smithellaceae bacterium]MDD3259354.1 polyprenyl synthetase family protein [Smithellaceae bacterium]MDD3849446.1 polyprenyl synthetase family protein [Smithellaceae bacterium]HOG12830.1 polyprenyl synthetase family protein [Smithellaceae bacterium]HOQ72656.1 polyprenyl synthetase family protein [Smithellaceae bacterium]